MENTSINAGEFQTPFNPIPVSMAEKVRAYIQLMKPTIILLFILTGVSAMVIERSILSNSFQFWMIVLGMFLNAGSANAFNQYYDRDIDAIMGRTKKKRPIPQGKISPKEALQFAWVTGILSIIILYSFGNFTTAFWGIFTIFYYVVIYTLWLKRRTPYNIVIGGAAGATAPLIGWAAAHGSLGILPWTMFFIVFMWTPPHFWSLALCVKEEYAKVSVPMLPVVAGEKRTRLEIFLYSILLLPVSLIPVATKDAGAIYLIGASLLGIDFIRRSLKVVKYHDKKTSWANFGFSIVYLFGIFILLTLDALLRHSV